MAFKVFKKTKTVAGPQNRLSTLPEHNMDTLPAQNTDASMLHFAAAGRTKPLLFSEAYEDFVVLKQRQVSKIFGEVDPSRSHVRIRLPIKDVLCSPETPFPGRRRHRARPESPCIMGCHSNFAQNFEEGHFRAS